MPEFGRHKGATTDAEREAAFQAYLANTIPYFETVRAKGDEPWFRSEDERRELFMRRYRRSTGGAQ